MGNETFTFGQFRGQKFSEVATSDPEYHVRYMNALRRKHETPNSVLQRYTEWFEKWGPESTGCAKRAKSRTNDEAKALEGEGMGNETFTFGQFRGQKFSEVATSDPEYHVRYMNALRRKHETPNSVLQRYTEWFEKWGPESTGCAKRAKSRTNDEAKALEGEGMGNETFTFGQFRGQKFSEVATSDPEYHVRYMNALRRKHETPNSVLQRYTEWFEKWGPESTGCAKRAKSRTNDEAKALEGEGMGNETFTFGQFRGQKFSEVATSDPEYHVRYMNALRRKHETPNSVLQRYTEWFEKWGPESTGCAKRAKSRTNDEAKALEGEGMGNETFTFGQHRGQKFSEVATSDPEYHVRYMNALRRKHETPNSVLQRYTEWFEKWGPESTGCAKRAKSRTNDEAKALEGEGMGNETFTFGQFRGQKFSEVATSDPEYHVRYMNALRCKHETPNPVLQRYKDWFEKWGPEGTGCAKRAKSRTTPSARTPTADAAAMGREVLTFGQNCGQTFAQVAKEDPSYHLRFKDMDNRPNDVLDR